MFFYHPTLLMVGDNTVIALNFATALLGVFLLAAGAQGWFFGAATYLVRALLLGTALMMISGTVATDLIGLALAALLLVWQMKFSARPVPSAAT
jgi:TRAP-type uncharacterized transport system fused permease subunit